MVQALKRYTMRPAPKDVEIGRAELRGRTSLRGAIALVLHTPPATPMRCCSICRASPP
jgi:hypothetical protein